MTADPLAGWRESAAKQSILEFVAAVTDPDAPDFVPEVDRVAVFDNDGTISTEMPLYTQLAFALDRAAELGKPTSLEELQAAGLGGVLELVKLTHGSNTSDEFDAACRNWIATARHPRFGRSYASMSYQPMLELLSLLGDSGFSCWIFSGGGADFMRTWAPEVFGLPPHRLIGSVGTTEFRIGDAGPELVKGTDLQTLNDGPQKPISIHQHIAQRPPKRRPHRCTRFTCRRAAIARPGSGSSGAATDAGCERHLPRVDEGRGGQPLPVLAAVAGHEGLCCHRGHAA
jgi:hypothetical protein